MKEPSLLILTGGVLILGVGFTYAVVNNRPKTKVLAGGIGVILISSIFDVMGGDMAKFGASLIGIAVVAVLLSEGPSVIMALQKAQKG